MTNTINPITRLSGSITIYLDNNPPINAYQFCDLLPGISTIVNLCNIFLKIIPNADQRSSYTTYLKQKSLSRCLISIVPVVGNIIEIIYQIAVKKFNFTFSERFEALNAVRVNPKAYEYIETRYQEDLEIALAALTQEGNLLQFSGHLRKNKDAVKAAFKNNPFSFFYADKLIRSNKEVILELLELSKTSEHILRNAAESILETLDDSLRQDEDIALATINHSHFTQYCVSFLDRSFKENKKVMLALVKKFPECMKYASQELKDDQDLKKAAEQTN